MEGGNIFDEQSRLFPSLERITKWQNEELLLQTSLYLDIILQAFEIDPLTTNIVILKPNSGPVRLKNNNIYEKWIKHLQKNRTDWNNKFQ